MHVLYTSIHCLLTRVFNCVLFQGPDLFHNYLSLLLPYCTGKMPLIHQQWVGFLSAVFIHDHFDSDSCSTLGFDENLENLYTVINMFIPTIMKKLPRGLIPVNLSNRQTRTCRYEYFSQMLRVKQLKEHSLIASNNFVFISRRLVEGL